MRLLRQLARARGTETILFGLVTKEVIQVNHDSTIKSLAGLKQGAPKSAQPQTARRDAVSQPISKLPKDLFSQTEVVFNRSSVQRNKRWTPGQVIRERGIKTTPDTRPSRLHCRARSHGCAPLAAHRCTTNCSLRPAPMASAYSTTGPWP